MTHRNDIERRMTPAAEAGLEIRETSGDPVFAGHASVFNKRTAIGNPLTWGFLEEVAPVAFDRTLLTSDARMLVNHDTSMVLARQSAGDLRLNTDDIGLDTEGDMDVELSYAKDLVRNVQKRRITGMSFGFEVKDDSWSTVDYEATDKDGNSLLIPVDLRTILDVELYEVSPCTFPAYEETDAVIRALRHAPDVVRRREDLLKAEVPGSKQTIGRALDLMKELRAGKALSKANVELLQTVLDRLNVVAQSATDSRDDLSNLLGGSSSDTDANETDDSETKSRVRYLVPDADYLNNLGVRHGLLPVGRHNK